MRSRAAPAALVGPREAAWPRETAYDKLVGWAFGDFIFNTEFDMVSDMGKIRRAEFNETVDTGAVLLAAIRSLQDKKILPR